MSDRELCSWKEIAAYLGVSVTTAQSYERHRGLPVRRLPGARAQVRALVSELEAWKLSGERTISEPVRAAETPVPAVRPAWRSLLVLSLVIVTVAVAAVYWWGGAAPAGYRVDQAALVVLDNAGRELWRQVFASGLRATAYADGEQRFWTGDMDGDGQREVLFVPVPAGLVRDPVPLVCYDARGRELWRFSPSTIISTRTEVFAPPFVVRQFAVLPTSEVLVTSHHHLYYPNHVGLLSAKGELLRAYWHSGHLTQLAVSDVDRDGQVEAYLGGVNNARHAATLVVLDPARFGGAAQEDGGYQLQGLGVPVERARVLFARSCLNVRLEPYNVVTQVLARPGGIIVDVHERLTSLDPPSIQHHLDDRLAPTEVGVSDVFLGMHAQLHATGQLDHTFDNAERATLRAVTRIR